MFLDRVAVGLRLASSGLAMMTTRPTSKRTMADLLERQAAAHPARPFVLFEDRRLTYAEFNTAANRVAHWARTAGLRRGDVVALLMENRPEYLVTWAGLAKLGVITALINTNLHGKSLRHVLFTSRAECLIVGAECLSQLASLDAGELGGWRIFVWAEKGKAEELEHFPAGAQDLDRALSGQLTSNLEREVRAECRAGDDLFYLYTSGTTGTPKAARFSHLRFLMTGGLGMVARYGRRDVVYCALPLYHTAGGVVVVGAVLRCGAAMAIRRCFSASQFWDDIRRHRATAFQYVGEFCRYLLNQPPSARDRDHEVRIIVGNGLRQDVWIKFQQRFGIPRVLEFYGATEGNAALVNLFGKLGSVGRRPPRFYNRVRLVRYDLERESHPRDAKGRCIDCTAGEVGELIGRIPASSKNSSCGRFEGYTSRDETERRILRNAFKDGDTWFRSGDLLRTDRQGYFYFVDRVGDSFRWKGENVSTQEVAEILGGFPSLELAIVYGVRVDSAEGRAGMAALLLKNPEAFDGKIFYRFVTELLPPYAVPVFLRLQREADITGTFKPRKLDLERDGFDPARVKDSLLLKDDANRAYVPLTPERFVELRGGRVRL